MGKYGVLFCLVFVSPALAQSPIPGSQEVMYICPESPGLRFGKAQLDDSENDPTYHIPVCHSGKFLGKLFENPPILLKTLGLRRWGWMYVCISPLDFSDHRGFHTLQRGQDFVRGHLQSQQEVRDAQGRPLRLFE